MDHSIKNYTRRNYLVRAWKWQGGTELDIRNLAFFFGIDEQGLKFFKTYHEYFVPPGSIQAGQYFVFDDYSFRIMDECDFAFEHMLTTEDEGIKEKDWGTEADGRSTLHYIDAAYWKRLGYNSKP